MSRELNKDDMLRDPETENTSSEVTEVTSDEADPFAAFEQPQTRQKEDLKVSSKKKKKILLFSLIGAFATLAILIVLLVFIFPAEKPEEPTVDPEDTGITILDKTSLNEEVVISSAIVEHPDGTRVEFVNKNDSLLVKGYEKLTPHSLNNADIVAVLTAFTATQDLGHIDDDKAFGFVTPLATGSVQYQDGSSFAFELGALAPDGTGYYFREKGSTHTYVLPLASAETLLLGPLDYISTTVFSGPIAESNTQSEVVLRDMALSGTVRAGNEFSFRLVTSEDSDEYLYYTYVITKPYLKGVSSTHTTDLSAFTSLSAQSVVAAYPTAQQLREFGLNTPYSVADFTLALRSNKTTEAGGETATITTYTDPQPHTIRVGNRVGNAYYVMVDEVPVVYLASLDDLPFVTLQFNDLADSMLFLENISGLGNVTVTLEGETTSFDLTHNEKDTDTRTNLTVTANGKTYDTMDFRYLIRVFMGVERYSNLTKDIGDKPVHFSISLTHTGEDKPVFTAKFYEMSSNLYAAVINNGERYQVRASDLKNAITQYQNYLKGEAVLY